MVFSRPVDGSRCLLPVVSVFDVPRGISRRSPRAVPALWCAALHGECLDVIFYVVFLGFEKIVGFFCDWMCYL